MCEWRSIGRLLMACSRGTCAELGYEPVADPVPRFNRARIICMITQRLAQLSDRLGDGTAGYGLVAPDRIEQLILAYHRRCTLHQILQNQKGLTPQRQFTGRMTQCPLVRIENELEEFVAHGVSLLHRCAEATRCHPEVPMNARFSCEFHACCMPCAQLAEFVWAACCPRVRLLEQS